MSLGNHIGPIKGYVVHKDRRYRVVKEWGTAGEGGGTVRMLRLKPFKGPEVVALANECTFWKRGSVRHIKGTLPHRDRRPVYIDLDTGAETIRVRLKGKRRALTCTFGGLYDVLARQQAINTKRDRAHAKRTGRRT